MTIIDPTTIPLDRGAHDDPKAGMCLLEAVAFVAGEPHSDRPTCTSPVLGAFGRSLNDVLPDGKRQRLALYIPAMIGTAGDGLDERRGYIAFDWLIRTWMPAFLALHERTREHAAAARALDPIVDVASAERARVVIRAAQAAAAAAGAAGAAAQDAARAAAGDAAGDAAGAAARATAGAAARAAAGLRRGTTSHPPFSSFKTARLSFCRDSSQHRTVQSHDALGDDRAQGPRRAQMQFVLARHPARRDLHARSGTGRDRVDVEGLSALLCRARALRHCLGRRVQR